eukprot:gene7922-5535_t
MHLTGKHHIPALSDAFKGIDQGCCDRGRIEVQSMSAHYQTMLSSVNTAIRKAAELAALAKAKSFEFNLRAQITWKVPFIPTPIINPGATALSSIRNTTTTTTTTTSDTEAGKGRREFDLCTKDHQQHQEQRREKTTTTLMDNRCTHPSMDNTLRHPSIAILNTVRLTFSSLYLSFFFIYSYRYLFIIFF